MSDELVALVTCPGDCADKIASTLVDSRLVACVNVIPAVTSVYRWEGKVEKDQESLLIIKTRRAAWKQFEEKVKELHPYDVPEIIAVPIEVGNSDYLTWLCNSIAGNGDRGE